MLQLPPDTTRIDVHKAYRRLMRQHHRHVDALHKQLTAKMVRIEAASEAAKKVIEERATVPSSHHKPANNKNKPRTRAGVVRCQMCKRDCTNDGRNTELCCTECCFNECHSDCVPTDQLGIWCCETCAEMQRSTLMRDVEEQKEQECVGSLHNELRPQSPPGGN